MLFVILGAIIGAIMRYEVGLILSISWQAVMFVNIVGTFILAFINFIWQSHWSINLKKFFATGFCGSFTTLSAFNWQIIQLAKNNIFQSLLYCIMTLTSSLLMIVLAKSIVKYIKQGESI